MPGATVRDFKLTQDMSKLWKGQQTVQLIAEWCHLGLVMFREDAWGTPKVHPSAAADILAGVQFPDPPQCPAKFTDDH